MVWSAAATLLHVGHYATPTPTPEPAVMGLGLPTLAAGLVGLGVALTVAWYAATRG